MGLLNPAEFAEGGILNDVIALFKKCRFVMFDYQGKADPAPSLKIELEVDGDDQVHEQYWSVGGADKWKPSEDGLKLVPIGTATHLNTSTRIYQLLKTLVDCGFPADKLGDDIGVLDGLKAHVVQIPFKTNMEPAAGEKKKDQTVLVIDKIINLPWETSSTPKATRGRKAGSTASTTATAAPAPDLTTKAADYVKQMLTKAFGDGTTSIPKNQFMRLCYNDHGLKDDPDKAAISKLLTQDDFLKQAWDADGVEWKYENGELTLA
jgi:hypothetical protein